MFPGRKLKFLEDFKEAPPKSPQQGLEALVELEAGGIGFLMEGILELFF